MSEDRENKQSEFSRREFLGMALAGTVAAGLSGNVLAEEKKGDIPYRTLGRTGEKVSAVGLGGYHMGEQKDEAESIRIVRMAVDNGITFMDNCWDYHDGQSEIRMGKALRDGYREKVFLMSKIDGQDKKTAAKQIDESLKRLQVDHVDLMQQHEVIRPGDPDEVFAEGGAIEALQEAKKAGKIRFIGFTGHKSPEIHNKMLETAFAHGFVFDTVQLPLNVMDAHYNSFEKQTLPMLLEHNIGVLGMKPLGSGILLKSGKVDAIECLHYAMSLPTSVVITGCDSIERLEQALKAARMFKPLSKEQKASLLSRTAEVAKNGEFEKYKTSKMFDGTVHNPEWLG